MTNDFYDLLGVDEDASKEEIRDAFREMVQEYHPDRNDDPRATAQFTAIKKAYDTLKSSSERQSYDRLGHSTYVSKRMDGMPDPSSWPSEDEDEDDVGASKSSSTGTTTGSGSAGSSSATRGSSSTTRSSSGTSRSDTSSHGPGSSGSGRTSTRSSTGSTSRSSTSSSTSGSSSSTSSSSRSKSGSSRSSSSSSRSTTSGSSSSTSAGTSSKAGSTGNSAGTSSKAGSTVGDGGTAQADAANAAAAGGGSGATGRTTGSTSEGSSLTDNAVVQGLQRALFGWPSIFLSTALYLAGIAHYGYSNRSGLASLAESLRAAGADTAALRAALEGNRYGIATATEYVSTTVPSDPAAAAGWLFVAGLALMPIVFFLVIHTTRKYPGWKPTYLYVVGVTAPAIGVGATVALGAVPLAAELLAYGILPVLAITTLIGRGFVWPRLKALGS